MCTTTFNSPLLLKKKKKKRRSSTIPLKEINKTPLFTKEKKIREPVKVLYFILF